MFSTLPKTCWGLLVITVLAVIAIVFATGMATVMFGRLMDAKG